MDMEVVNLTGNLIYKKLHKINIVKTMKSKIIASVVIVIMLFTSLTPAIASSKEAKPIIYNKNVERIKEEIKPFIKTLEKRSSNQMEICQNKPTMRRTGFFSRYLYLYIRYGHVDKWIKIDRFSYFLNKLKGKRGISIDVDGDTTKDILVDFKFIPKIVRKPRATLAYDSLLSVKKLQTCSLDQPRSFEIRLYFYIPKIFSEELISIGYLSPLGSYIPEFCEVHHLFIPYFMRAKDNDRYVSLEYVATNPSAKVIMLSGEGGDGNSSWTAVESGHISITGSIEADIDGTFEVNGEEIKLSGTFYLNTKNDTVDIWWNTTRGYFKINGSGSFHAKNIHFDADGKIIFDVKTISLGASGYVEIDQSEKRGDLLLDGVADLGGLSFEINIDKNETEFSGTFEISANGILDNFRLSWDDSGFSADGYVDGELTFNITNLHLTYGNFTVNAGKISIGAALSLEFIKNGEIVICTISSAGASINDLYLEYSEHSTTLDHIDIKGTLTINLEMVIQGGEYVTVEEGHISISGDTEMNISITTSVNGTDITLVGVFTLNTKNDTVDIWWNTTEGYIKINGSSHFSVKKFFLSIENLGIVTIDKLILDADGNVIINESGKEGNILINGNFDLSGLKVSLDANGEHLVVKGSFDFSLDSE
ncbi:MAG: hypothetical protein DRH24_16040, partial [Deltaproteobacteria bacterium]